MFSCAQAIGIIKLLSCHHQASLKMPGLITQVGIKIKTKRFFMVLVKQVYQILQYRETGLINALLRI